MLQRLQKQNAFVLKKRLHVHLVRPDELLMIAMMANYLKDNFEIIFINGEGQKGAECT